MLLKKYWLLVPAIAMALVVAFPAQALNMTGSGPTTQVPQIQGRVLGATTIFYDINGDGVVNSLDAGILIAHIGENYPPADLNHDGVVNSLDLSLLSSWWFATK